MGFYLAFALLIESFCFHFPLFFCFICFLCVRVFVFWRLDRTLHVMSKDFTKQSRSNHIYRQIPGQVYQLKLMLAIKKRSYFSWCTWMQQLVSHCCWIFLTSVWFLFCCRIKANSFKKKTRHILADVVKRAEKFYPD